MFKGKSKVTILLVVLFILTGGNVVALESNNEITVKDNRLEDGYKQDPEEIYRGSAIAVFKTDSEIIVENISSSPLAIRVSWNKTDPHGTGEGVDSFINNFVPQGKQIKRKFNDYISVQVWAWNSSGALVDSCNLSISVEKKQ